MQNSLSNTELRVLRHIRNALVHEGRTPTTLEIARFAGRRSSRTGALIVQALETKGFVRRKKDKSLQLLREVPEDRSVEETILVPIVGTAPCGEPLLAEQNIEAYVRVSRRLAAGNHRYFLLRADGDSMDKAGIGDGDLALVRQQPVAENGDRIVALIDDTATIKRFHRHDDVIALEPQSTNRTHKPIYLTHDFQVQGVVVATIPDRKKG